MEREEIVNIDLPQWELLPDIGLYMDQVITLMDRTFSPALPKGEMTKSMVNNYVKVGLIPRPVGKKYDRVSAPDPAGNLRFPDFPYTMDRYAIHREGIYIFTIIRVPKTPWPAAGSSARRGIADHRG